jgi:Fibronectin type III domain/Carboxypeptidase regulatory-like domain
LRQANERRNVRVIEAEPIGEASIEQSVCLGGHRPPRGLWANERRTVRAIASVVLFLGAQFGLYAAGTGTAGADTEDVVFARGNAAFFGSPQAPLPDPLTAMAAPAAGDGYHVMDSRGRVQAFGAASHFGDTSWFFLSQPMADMAVRPGDDGYWLLSKDGGLFNFGAASFFGSASSAGGEAVSIVATPTGMGYWIALADGRVFDFGDAVDLPDPSGSSPGRIVGMARTATGLGYWLVSETGAVFEFGDAIDHGDGVSTGKSFAAIVARTDGAGYWLLATDGAIVNKGLAAAYPAVVSSYEVVAGAARSGGLWVASSGKPPPGAIEGVVTDTNGQPLANMCVQAQSGPYQTLAGAFTSVTGFYRLGELPPFESYRVVFHDCWNQSYLTEWYDNASSFDTATPVAVESGQTTTGIDGSLELGGFITGSVRDDAGEFAFACVTAVDHETGAVGSGYSGYWVTGSYRVGPLKAGSYVVTFTDCGWGDKLSQSWPAADYPSTGQAVNVASGNTVKNINGVLRTAGAIAGVVTDSSGNPANGICVDARRPGEQYRSAETNDIAFGFTSVTGYYRLSGLRQGSYAVHYRDCAGTGLAEEWFHDALAEQEADAVHVLNGKTTNEIDESLAPGAVVTGSVESSEGPLANACVSAWREGEAFAAATSYSSVTGFYRIGGLKAGSYKVNFRSCWAGDFAPEWWDNSPTKAGGAALDLSPGEQMGGVSASLGVSGSVSGVVRGPAGAVRANACVTAEDAAGIVHSGWTSVTGFYRITGLSSQAYKVRFDPCGSGSGAMEWFNNKANEVVANSVNVTAGSNTPGIHAQFDQVGSIRGVVRETGGRRAQSVCIDLTDTAGNIVREGVSTSITGWYNIGGLHGGNYKMRFADCDPNARVPEWANNRQLAANADVIAVTVGSAKTVDAEVALHVADAPTGVTATAGNSSASVSWTPQGYSGTSPVTEYEVTAWTGGFPVRTVVVPAPQTSTVVTGLQNSTQYRFRVAARNSYGLGKQSLLSNQVTPALTASIATPGTVSAPAVVTFSDTVKGVTTSNLVIRQTGSGANLAASVTCKNQGGSTVSCTSGLVRSAVLQPTAPLTAGQSYTVVVNPVGVTPIRDFAGNIVDRTSQTFEAGSAVASVRRT